jgi:hypothetical protein
MFSVVIRSNEWFIFYGGSSFVHRTAFAHVASGKELLTRRDCGKNGLTSLLHLSRGERIHSSGCRDTGEVHPCPGSPDVPTFLRWRQAAQAAGSYEADLRFGTPYAQPEPRALSSVSVYGKGVTAKDIVINSKIHAPELLAGPARHHSAPVTAPEHQIRRLPWHMLLRGIHY